MGRRKSNPNASSLDLFLDTICNAFGGIMFLSILISVLAQLQGNNGDAADATPVTKEEAAQMAQQITESQAERAQLMAMIQKLEQEQLGGDESQLIDMLGRLEEAQKKLNEMVTQQLQTSSKLSDAQAEVETLQQEAEKVKRELSESRAALVAKQKALNDALDAHEQKVQLPQAKISKKTNILLAMRYGKVYLVTDPSQPGAGNFFSDHVEKLVADSGVRIRPKQDSGWVWSDTQTAARLNSAIANRRPADCFLTVAVWPDSFDAFGELKQHIVQLGYEYELLPLADVPTILIDRGSSPIVQ